MNISEIKYYTVEEIRTIKELKDIYNEHTAATAWLFLSLASFHGTPLTLDDLELILANEHNETLSENGRWWITAMVVFPQSTSAVLLNYAEIMVDADDVQWLRDKVRETLIEVEASQYGNT